LYKWDSFKSDNIMKHGNWERKTSAFVPAKPL
jgi:hypothetical protein